MIEESTNKSNKTAREVAVVEEEVEAEEEVIAEATALEVNIAAVVEEETTVAEEMVVEVTAAEAIEDVVMAVEAIEVVEAIELTEVVEAIEVTEVVVVAAEVEASLVKESRSEATRTKLQQLNRPTLRRFLKSSSSLCLLFKSSKACLAMGASNHLLKTKTTQARHKRQTR